MVREKDRVGVAQMVYQLGDLQGSMMGVAPSAKVTFRQPGVGNMVSSEPDELTGGQDE